MKKLFTLSLFLLFSFLVKAQINWQVSNQVFVYSNYDYPDPSIFCTGPVIDIINDTIVYKIYSEPGAGCPMVYRKTDLVNDSIYIHWSLPLPPFGCTMDEPKYCTILKIIPFDSITSFKLKVLNGSYNDSISGTWYNIKRLGNTLIFNDFAVPISDFKLTTFSNPTFTKLNWSLTNNNSQNFIVERSLNGSHFEAIANLKANKNSSEKDIYSFTDETKNNSFFYRIKNIDIDEKFTYSNTEYVKNDFKKSGISVVENPLNNNYIKIHFEGQKDENFTIKLVDILGNIIYKNELMISNDDYYFNQTIQLNSSKILIAQLENQSTEIITFFKLLAQ